MSGASEQSTTSDAVHRWRCAIQDIQPVRPAELRRCRPSRRVGTAEQTTLKRTAETPAAASKATQTMSRRYYTPLGPFYADPPWFSAKGATNVSVKRIFQPDPVVRQFSHWNLKSVAPVVWEWRRQFRSCIQHPCAPFGLTAGCVKKPADSG